MNFFFSDTASVVDTFNISLCYYHSQRNAPWGSVLDAKLDPLLTCVELVLLCLKCLVATEIGTIT